jgi:uncharacterized membrane protein (TIGR02234 family)
MADTRRRTFGPVVLAGLATAGLAALAGNRAWAEWTGEPRGRGSLLTITGGDQVTVPLAGALALVVLACWGVLLVTRGKVRRAVAALALLVSVGMVATSVFGYLSATVDLRNDLEDAGAADLTVEPTVWYYLFLVSALLAIVAAGAALVLAPAWPEMGSRYDAPGSTRPPREATSVDLWRALDEGRDPTLTDRKPTDP